MMVPDSRAAGRARTKQWDSTGGKSRWALSRR
jgi:hypothetical protein